MKRIDRASADEAIHRRESGVDVCVWVVGDFSGWAVFQVATKWSEAPIA